ncbi:MAG: hypothetical protein PHW52_01740 [Candidatus Pacebacteria bacterium]|nr:hypothetical protein [Candidatus Paceibacterota bacterium]
MLINSYISLLIAGFGGGLIRGILGYLKHQYDYKNVGFDVKYFFGMSFISGVIGMMASVAINESGIMSSVEYFTPAFAFIVGYAGGDFLDGVYKIILGKNKG